LGTGSGRRGTGMQRVGLRALHFGDDPPGGARSWKRCTTRYKPGFREAAWGITPGASAGRFLRHPIAKIAARILRRDPLYARVSDRGIAGEIGVRLMDKERYHEPGLDSEQGRNFALLTEEHYKRSTDMSHTEKLSAKSKDDSEHFPEYPDPQDPRSFPIAGDLLMQVTPVPPGVRIKTRPSKPVSSTKSSNRRPTPQPEK
jgi:hypothetical protein